MQLLAAPCLPAIAELLEAALVNPASGVGDGHSGQSVGSHAALHDDVPCPGGGGGAIVVRYVACCGIVKRGGPDFGDVPVPVV